VLAQVGFIMHCNIFVCKQSFSNSVKRKVMPVEETESRKEGLEGVLAQLEEILSKSMDESSSST
jgi:hypothetical protein